MNVFLFIGYILTFIVFIIICIIQFFAIYDGIAFAFGITGFWGYFLASSSPFPFVGSAFGVYGAVNAWNWGFIQAFLLFFWYLPIGLIAMIVIFVIGKFLKK